MDWTPSPLSLAQKLLSFITIAPEESEQECADYLTTLLDHHGFQTAQYAYEPNRPTVVAELDGNSGKPPICFTGHLDTVPLGAKPWAHDPFQGEVVGDKLYGRGAADMKCGVAAIVSAALQYANSKERKSGVKLVLTAGEELGCKGSQYLASLPEAIGTAGALVVAEPTSNEPVCCHRGAFWLNITAHGKTAHGSQPALGDNAIYKIVNMINRLQLFQFNVPDHPLLGPPTLNVGTIGGGENINSVPDQASFTVDIRTLPRQSHAELLERLQETLGTEAGIDIVTDLMAVETDPDHPWMRQVRTTAESFLNKKLPPQGKLAFTDAAALTAGLGFCPTVILGPGDSEMCHQTDEYCRVSKIDQAAKIYTQLMSDWCAA